MQKCLAAAALLLALTGAALGDQSSKCIPTTGVLSGLSFVQDVNGGFKAELTLNSGATAPANDCSAAPVLGQFWLDTTSATPVVRFFDGTFWEPFGTINPATGIWMPAMGGGLDSLASASTTDLWSKASSFVTITGTIPITQLALAADALPGAEKTVLFQSALTLTYDATKLKTPTAQSIAIRAGDIARVVALGGNNVQVAWIVRADGSPLVPAGPVGNLMTSTGNNGWVSLPNPLLYLAHANLGGL